MRRCSCLSPTLDFLDDDRKRQADCEDRENRQWTARCRAVANEPHADEINDV